MKEAAWASLEVEKSLIAKEKLQDLFQQDPKRFEKFSLEIEGLLLDYSKQRITEHTFKKLISLAESAGLSTKIKALFSGEVVNRSENRPALHTALRDFSANPLMVQGEDIKVNIAENLLHMEDFSDKLRSGEYRSPSGQPITDVLCLGIGGSELGPYFVCEALEQYKITDLRFHFVSNVFGPTLEERLKTLRPESTLCIISSKTFTTPETLQNALSVKAWFESTIKTPYMVAITANPKRAEAFGISKEFIFEFWDWVGGRYSIWSSVGLPVVLKIGMDHFKSFLRGARKMDSHFYSAPFSENMPVIMGLLGLWNHNFLEAKTYALLPYDDRLRSFPAYLQQLEMESNGKRVDESGEYLSISTAPVVWGGVGCNGQHAYMQLLHQGTQMIPVDFLIGAKISPPEFQDQHKLLMASCLSQSKALMEGEMKEASKDGVVDPLNKAKSTPGNCPSNTLIYSELTPHTLGSLIALYEHKIFVQGVLWGINSFDQWGVELGKTLAKNILPHLDQELDKFETDSSTKGLISYFQKQNV